ncbi:Pre-mRNA cleavage complex 2 protein Pcf11 [Halotydeus destructor]|nr:Pre-mRNA cleavage complex 2 protein Pcf11 [Halotydeus destructor]
MAQETQAVADYKSSLEDLTFNSKPHISMLTMLADDYKETSARDIVKAIEERIHKVKNDKKLPLLYLLDCICKNVDGGLYINLFSEKIIENFSHVFEKTTEDTRAALHKLRGTWSGIFPASTLYELDLKVNQIDPAWPILSKPKHEPLAKIPKLEPKQPQAAVNGAPQKPRKDPLAPGMRIRPEPPSPKPLPRIPKLNQRQQQPPQRAAVGGGQKPRKQPFGARRQEPIPKRPKMEPNPPQQRMNGNGNVQRPRKDFSLGMRREDLRRPATDFRLADLGANPIVNYPHNDVDLRVRVMNPNRPEVAELPRLEPMPLGNVPHTDMNMMARNMMQPWNVMEPARPVPVHEPPAPALPSVDLSKVYAALRSITTKNLKQEPQASPVEERKYSEPPLLLSVESLKQATRKSLVASLYNGFQCSSCSQRFTEADKNFVDGQTSRYAKHLDWHFQINRIHKDSKKSVKQRQWYCSFVDWFNLRHGDIEKLEVMDTAEKEAEQSEASEEPTLPAHADETLNKCKFCGEPFEQVFSDDDDGWILKNALNRNGIICHPVCYREGGEEVLPTGEETKVTLDEGENDNEQKPEAEASQEMETNEVKSEVGDERESSRGEGVTDPVPDPDSSLLTELNEVKSEVADEIEASVEVNAEKMDTVENDNVEPAEFIEASPVNEIVMTSIEELIQDDIADTCQHDVPEAVEKEEVNFVRSGETDSSLCVIL